MKNNLWYKNSVNNPDNSKNANEKGNMATVTMGRIMKKPKRIRSAFTTEQVNYLEREYKKYPYIGTGHRKEIATSLNIAERTVKIWFQNRRMKEKKEAINKEFCDQHTGQQVEFAKSRLNNVVSMQSTNDQSLNSLPLLADVDNNVTALLNSKAFNAEGNRIASRNTYLFGNMNHQQRKAELKLLAFQKNRGSLKDSRLSTCVNSCKKYVTKINNVPTKSNPTDVKPQGPCLQNSNSLKPKITPEDLSTKRPSLLTKQKPCSGYDQSISGYVPVVPNFYPQPFVSPGGVLWKPVIMPVMSGRHTITSNDFNESGISEQNKKKCVCNCHSKSILINRDFQNVSNPQYVLTALPLQNPSTQF